MAAIGLFFVIFGAGQWINGARLGQVVAAVGFALWAFTLFQWFRDAIGESEGGLYGKHDRRLVPLEHELVHLLGGDVLRRLLRRAVLVARCIRCRRSAASTTRCCGPTSRPSGRASAPGARLAGRHRSSRSRRWARGRFPTINTALLLTSGVTLTIAHHALIANQRAQDDRLHVDHRAARRHLPRLAGLRVHPRLQRPEPEAQLRRLRLDLLHADRLPRLPRVRRHADAAVHHAAAHARATSRRERHFGFEGAAWYWHFVDVVWLGLYIVVYWL